MMFFAIYFDSIKKIKILSVNSESTIVRTGFLMLIGVAQAIILGVILQHFPDLKIADLGVFYLSCILFSLVSVFIVQFLIVHIGDLGKLLAILLLIFQLTSGGGIFLIETAPNFYSSFNAYLPITYSIDLFRQSIINQHAESARKDILIEIAFMPIMQSSLQSVPRLPRVCGIFRWFPQRLRRTLHFASRCAAHALYK